jgi:hypothetical protein
MGKRGAKPLKPAAPPKQKRAKASHLAAAEPLALSAAAAAAPDAAAAAEESREVKQETLHVILLRILLVFGSRGSRKNRTMSIVCGSCLLPIP